MDDVDIIRIYTDGACVNNPGRGGWAFVIIKDQEVLDKQSGSEENSTNNKMELLSAIKSLEEVNNLKVEHKKINLYSDSAYLVNCFNDNWIEKWINNGWKNSKNQAVSNKELWLRIISLNEKFNIEYILTKGHSTMYGKAVDRLAHEAAKYNTTFSLKRTISA